MNFYRIFLGKCLSKGVSPSKAAIEAGTTKSAVNRWKNGSTPSDSTMMKLAEYFGCPVSDFLADAKKPATDDGDGPEVSDDSVRAEINELYDFLDASDRARLLAFAQGLKLSQDPRGEDRG